MNSDLQALFDELQVAVVLPEKELDDGGVLKVNPTRGKFIDCVLQPGMVSGTPPRKSETPPWSGQAFPKKQKALLLERA